jgi:hypothetical protein
MLGRLASPWGGWLRRGGGGCAFGGRAQLGLRRGWGFIY